MRIDTSYQRTVSPKSSANTKSNNVGCFNTMLTSKVNSAPPTTAAPPMHNYFTAYSNTTNALLSGKEALFILRKLQIALLSGENSSIKSSLKALSKKTKFSIEKLEDLELSALISSLNLRALVELAKHDRP